MAEKAVQAEQSIKKENKMGTMPVNKLLLSMALPMIVSMLVQALYNIVDSIFVAQLSENALTAVSMAFPIQNLMIGMATGIGVGECVRFEKLRINTTKKVLINRHFMVFS